MSRTRDLANAAIIGLVAFLPSAALSQTINLKFTTLNPAESFLVVKYMRPWAERINEEAKGLVKIQEFDGFVLANNLNAYDRVMSDVIQITWANQTYEQGQFPGTDVVSLPLTATDSEQVSVALWRLYADGTLAKEYSNLHPFLLIGVPQQGIQTRTKPVKTLEDVRGLRLIAGGKMNTEGVTAIGAAPLSINVGDMYEALQRSTADGCIMPYTAFNPFKLDEVTKYHLEVPFGSAGAMVFMSKTKWDSLPPAVQKIFDDNSGEAASRAFAKVWDAENKRERDVLMHAPGHTVTALTSAELKPWADRLESVKAAWIKATPNGTAIASAFEKYVGQVKAEEAKQ